MNPASRGISGVSLTPREKQKKKSFSIFISAVL